MKIGVLSDTHIPRRARTIPKAVLEGLQGVDLIIHCGDIAEEWVLEELRELAPVEAVYGNMDPAPLKEKLPKTKIIQAEGFLVGIVHGDGPWVTIDNAFNAFPFAKIDCIVFGHSHVPIIAEREGITLLNPGSPTDKRGQENYSYGLLHIGEAIKAELILFSKASAGSGADNTNSL